MSTWARPGRVARLRPVVPGVWILFVRHRRLIADGDVPQRVEETVDIFLGGGYAGTRADGARDVAAIAANNRRAVLGDLRGTEAEQAQEVGMSAETAVPDTDAVFCAEARRDEPIRHAIDDERNNGQRISRNHA